MAKLFSEKNDTCLQLSLFKLKEDKNWISYELTISAKNIKNNDFIIIFKLSETQELYLDAFYDPEVPTICSGFERVLMGSISNFIFEPADEKDFFLELKKQGNSYFIDFFSDYILLLEQLQWENSTKIGVRIKTTAEKISQFTVELQKEYDKLMSLQL